MFFCNLCPKFLSFPSLSPFSPFVLSFSPFSPFFLSFSFLFFSPPSPPFPSFFPPLKRLLFPSFGAVGSASVS